MTHQKISFEEYQNEIKNFIGLSIDKVNILYDQYLFIGGFSLVHIVNDEKKEGKIVSFNGHMVYKSGKCLIETNTHFKDVQNGMKFQKQANDIKKEIINDSEKVKDIFFDFNEKSNKVTIVFNNNATFTIETFTDQGKPISYDDDSQKYAIYFGEKITGDGDFTYLKSVFS